MSLPVSVCIPVRNEEANLPDCRGAAHRKAPRECKGDTVEIIGIGEPTPSTRKRI